MAREFTRLLVIISKEMKEKNNIYIFIQANEGNNDDNYECKSVKEVKISQTPSN